MATAGDVLAVARSQIGYTESPPGSNRTVYGLEYGMNGQPWCDMFVWWCGQRAGAEDIIGRFAYCPYHADWFKRQGRWVDRSQAPQPGDVVFFAHVTKRGIEACHVGFVERVEGGAIRTIEGNTSVTSNDNGGAVMRRRRELGAYGSNWFVLGYGRPAYSDQQQPTTKRKRRKHMECIYQPNGEGRLVYYDGGKCHPLEHPDEVTAIQMVYRACNGCDIPMFELGSAEAPWATRFEGAVERGA